jgi:hypothetical protein
MYVRIRLQRLNFRIKFGARLLVKDRFGIHIVFLYKYLLARCMLV